MTRPAAIAALLLALLPAASRAQLLSPGPLSRAHARLEGDTQCTQCHSEGRRVDTNACLRCHQDLGARIRAGQGLHGRQYRGRDCGGCHVEHIGTDARLVRWPGGRMEALDHALTGWALEGAHARQGCLECHDRRNTRGARTFLGLRTACGSCHQDPHAGRFGATCQGCHEKFRRPKG